MRGVTGNVSELGGSLGNNHVSSVVQCVCEYFGPTDFLRMNERRGRMDHNAADSPESLLIGGSVPEHPERVAHASPLTYGSAAACPFLIAHGLDDQLMLYEQSELLHRALVSAGVSSELRLVPGAIHRFDQVDQRDLVEVFFAACLRG